MIDLFLVTVVENGSIDFGIFIIGAVVCSLCLATGLFSESPISLLLDKMSVSEKNIIQAIYDSRDID